MSVAGGDSRQSGRRPIEPGRGTASPLNVSYRVGRIAPYLSGRWLDFGCADGGYTGALLESGATFVDGVDVEADRIAAAAAMGLQRASFSHVTDSHLPFQNDAFDGAFLNEVLEHVGDERAALLEIRRVLRESAYIVVMSPNRWFPFEGHAVHIRGRTFGPAPLVPWLPERLTRGITVARNYWPYQLVRAVRLAGFDIIEVGYIWPVLEQYPWLPRPMIETYQHYLKRLDDVPGLRRFGVSTLVVGRKPRGDGARFRAAKRSDVGKRA